MLIENYYTITDCHSDSDTTVFSIALNAGCKVYEGHFPAQPVSPGVCNMQMLLECAEQVAGMPLRISKISKCRFTKLITPVTHPTLEARIILTDDLALNATLGNGDDVCMSLTAQLMPLERAKG